MGCATSSQPNLLHFADEDGKCMDFWIKDGKLQYSLNAQASDGSAVEVKEVVKLIQLGDSSDGYLYDDISRLWPMTEGQFRKLQPLASHAGLRVEPPRQAKVLEAKLLQAGDQVVFRPSSGKWSAGEYHHFCRPGTVVALPEQDYGDARGCLVLCPRRRAEQWALWEDLRFFAHAGSSRVTNIEVQDTVSSLVDGAGRAISVDAADFADDLIGFRAAVAQQLGRPHPLARDACCFTDINGEACKEMRDIFIAAGKGDVTATLDRQLLAKLEVPPRVFQMSGQEVAIELGRDAFLVSDLRLALARPLGHTPLAVPGFRLIDAQGKTLEDSDYICEASILGNITVVLDQEVIAELESPSNLAIAIACKAAESEDLGTFHHGMFNGQTQEVKLLYNYCRWEESSGYLPRQRYDFHVYSLQEKQFVDHGHVGAD